MESVETKKHQRLRNFKFFTKRINNSEKLSVDNSLTPSGTYDMTMDESSGLPAREAGPGPGDTRMTNSSSRSVSASSLVGESPSMSTQKSPAMLPVKPTLTSQANPKQTSPTQQQNTSFKSPVRSPSQKDTPAPRNSALDQDSLHLSNSVDATYATTNNTPHLVTSTSLNDSSEVFSSVTNAIDNASIIPDRMDLLPKNRSLPQDKVSREHNKAGLHDSRLQKTLSRGDDRPKTSFSVSSEKVPKVRFKNSSLSFNLLGTKLHNTDEQDHHHQQQQQQQVEYEHDTDSAKKVAHVSKKYLFENEKEKSTKEAPHAQDSTPKRENLEKPSEIFHSASGKNPLIQTVEIQRSTSDQKQAGPLSPVNTDSSYNAVIRSSSSTSSSYFVEDNRRPSADSENYDMLTRESTGFPNVLGSFSPNLSFNSKSEVEKKSNSSSKSQANPPKNKGADSIDQVPSGFRDLAQENPVLESQAHQQPSLFNSKLFKIPFLKRGAGKALAPGKKNNLSTVDSLDIQEEELESISILNSQNSTASYDSVDSEGLQRENSSRSSRIRKAITRRSRIIDEQMSGDPSAVSITGTFSVKALLKLKRTKGSAAQTDDRRNAAIPLTPALSTDTENDIETAAATTTNKSITDTVATDSTVVDHQVTQPIPDQIQDQKDQHFIDPNTKLHGPVIDTTGIAQLLEFSDDDMHSMEDDDIQTPEKDIASTASNSNTHVQSKEDLDMISLSDLPHVIATMSESNATDQLGEKRFGDRERTEAGHKVEDRPARNFSPRSLSFKEKTQSDGKPKENLFRRSAREFFSSSKENPDSKTKRQPSRSATRFHQAENKANQEPLSPQPKSSFLRGSFRSKKGKDLSEKDTKEPKRVDSGMEDLVTHRKYPERETDGDGRLQSSKTAPASGGIWKRSSFRQFLFQNKAARPVEDMEVHSSSNESLFVTQSDSTNSQSSTGDINDSKTKSKSKLASLFGKKKGSGSSDRSSSRRSDSSGSDLPRSTSEEEKTKKRSLLGGLRKFTRDRTEESLTISSLSSGSSMNDRGEPSEEYGVAGFHRDSSRVSSYTSGIEILLARISLGQEEEEASLENILYAMFHLDFFLDSLLQESLFVYLQRRNIVRLMVEKLTKPEKPIIEVDPVAANTGFISRQKYPEHYVITMLFTAGEDEFRDLIMDDEVAKNMLLNYFHDHPPSYCTTSCVIDVMRSLLISHQTEFLEAVCSHPSFFDDLMTHLQILTVAEFAFSIIAEKSFKVLCHVSRLDIYEKITQTFISAVMKIGDYYELGEEERAKSDLNMKTMYEIVTNSASLILSIGTKVISIGMTNVANEVGSELAITISALNLFTNPTSIVDMLDCTMNFNIALPCFYLLRIVLKVMQNLLFTLLYDTGSSELFNTVKFESLVADRMNGLFKLVFNGREFLPLNEVRLSVLDYFVTCIKMGGPILIAKIIDLKIPEIMLKLMTLKPSNSILQAIVLSAVQSSLLREDNDLILCWIDEAQLIQMIVEKLHLAEKEGRASVPYAAHLEQMAISVSEYLAKPDDENRASIENSIDDKLLNEFQALLKNRITPVYEANEKGLANGKKNILSIGANRGFLDPQVD